MKYKVNVIAISLNRNKVAKFGDIIDSSQLPNPDNGNQLVKEGYLKNVKEVETEVEVETEESLEDKLNKLNKAQIKEYAIENGIDFNPDAKKADLVAEVLKNSD